MKTQNNCCFIPTLSLYSIRTGYFSITHNVRLHLLNIKPTKYKHCVIVTKPTTKICSFILSLQPHNCWCRILSVIRMPFLSLTQSTESKYRICIVVWTWTINNRPCLMTSTSCWVQLDDTKSPYFCSNSTICVMYHEFFSANLTQQRSQTSSVCHPLSLCNQPIFRCLPWVRRSFTKVSKVQNLQRFEQMLPSWCSTNSTNTLNSQLIND